MRCSPSASARLRRKAAGGLRTLYPAIKPNKSGMLRVSDTHEIYYEECGNPKGKPAVFVHGGPGAGCDNRARSFFDPPTPIASSCSISAAAAGASRTPASRTTPPGTWSEDMEKLRKHLGIEQWLVLGGSWGSTLGWPIRKRIPSRSANWSCAASSRCRSSSCAGSITEAARARCSPTIGKTIVAAIPPAERGDMIKAFYKRLTSEDRDIRVKAARAWSIWEAATSYLHVNEDQLHKWNEEDFASRSRASNVTTSSIAAS